MAEWKETRIGNVCDTISDTYKGEANEVVLINTSDVLEGKCLNHSKTLNKDLKGQFKKTFKRDDILYSEIRPANKRFAYIDFDPVDYIASTKLMVIRHRDNITPLYLYYILKSSSVIEELQMLAESRSGTFPQITFSELSKLEIKLPPIVEQERILGVLSSLDDKIENNRKINANLEAQAQALFKSWFVDFEPFNGKMPNDWRIGSLGEFAEISKTSVNPLKNPQTIFEHYSIPSYDDGMKPEMQQGEDIKSNKFVITNKMTLFSKLNPRIKRVWYVDKLSANAVCSTEFVPYKAKEESKSSFLYGLINSQGFYDFVMSKVNGATGSHQRFHPEESMKYKIAYNDEFLVKYCDFATPIINQILENRLESRRLASLRDTLLPRLMSGELKVNDINI